MRHISFSPPDISEDEIKEVSEALRSGWITTGPRTKLLERRIASYIETGKNDIDCNTKEAIDKYSNKVVCLNSATAAEELNLKVFGIKEGDEVIVPAYTYTATASAAIHCGATVRFVDIEKNGDSSTHAPEIDYNALESLINNKTKAIILVDIGGIICNYNKVYSIIKKHTELFTPIQSDGTLLGDLNHRIQTSIGRIGVFADAAHSFGGYRIIKGKKKYSGSLADFTSFSFHAVKNFTTAEGGASTWLPIKGIDNSEIYKMYQLLSLHGQDKDALSKSKLGAWEYDIIGAYYKCNMTDIAASIGLVQLDRYDNLLKRRHNIIRQYDKTLDELGIDHLKHNTSVMKSSGHLYLMRIPGIDEQKRNKMIEVIAENGIATNVHYKPLPMMTAYCKGGFQCPNSYDYYKNLISLPLHTLLSDGDVRYICEVLKNNLRMENVSNA